MNNDQLNSTIRTILKIAGAALATHGATKAASLINAEDTVGVLMTIVSWAWSHYTHKEDPQPAAPTPAKLPLWIFLPLLALAWLVGCSTSQIKTAAEVETGADVTVVGVMTGWDIYVGAKHPGTNAELKVLHAFNAVKAAEVTVVDATITAAKEPTNTAPLLAAEQLFESSKTNLITLISAITNATH